jgi:Tol biopolymer transport system component
VDELTLLRGLGIEEPLVDEAARAEVWRRLRGGETQDGATAGAGLHEPVGREQATRQPVRPRRLRLAVLVAAAIAVFVASASALGTVRHVLFGSGSHRTFDSPVWSPDGRKISFLNYQWDAGGDFLSTDVYVINADGSGQRNLTDEWKRRSIDIRPIWSPDWQRIAFVPSACAAVKGTCTRTAHIYVMNADGSGLHRVARAGTDRALSSGQRVGPRAPDPVWSPDGRKIAFGSERDGNVELYVVNPDGSDQRRLTRSPQSEESLTWSPDGRQIAFVRSIRGRSRTYKGITLDGRLLRQEIYVMNADGSGPRPLAAGSAPAWSPDGRKIAFRSARDGNGEVYIVNADGSGLRRLTRNRASDGDPVWSPNGKKIYFVRFARGKSDIYLMNADGSGQRNLSHNPAPPRDGRDNSPVVSPDGRKITFVSQRDGSTQIYVMNADGSGLRRLTHTDS